MSELPSARASGDGEVRPGAMTAAMRAAAPRSTGPRWLRWALIRDGRVVREEVRPPDRPLVIGEAADADVPLPALGVERHVLADGRGGAWRLRIAPAWSGRLGAGPVATLGVERPDGTREIRLDDDARGRLELGDASLLVQLVERPSERPTPRLPASIDGGVLHGADWWFTAFVTGSFVVHFALVAFLAEMDWPVATAAAVVPDRMVTQIYPEEEPPPELPEEAMDPDAPPDATEDAVAENDDPNRDDARSDDATEAPADRVARRTARPTLDP
ncbi:MAG TPA: hypothetical protein RMH99_20385 [Sandaracinaceae bacterium LLY-WYZ-13_1]|nr:hypothetical protein [Sandaracinaceae bacterium LLY-WYZ-13_1]